MIFSSHSTKTLLLVSSFFWLASVSSAKNTTENISEKSSQAQATEKLYYISNGQIFLKNESYVKKIQTQTPKSHTLKFYRPQDTPQTSQQFFTITYHYQPEKLMRTPARYIDRLMQQTYALAGKHYAINSWSSNTNNQNDNAAMSIQNIQENSIIYDFKRYVIDPLTDKGVYELTFTTTVNIKNKKEQQAILSEQNTWLIKFAKAPLTPEVFKQLLSAPLINATK